MLARDIMTKNPITVDGEISIAEAKRIMKEKNIRRLPVVDNGKLVGMVTERMILEVSPSLATSLSIYELHYLIAKMKVKDIMVRNPITISPATTFKDALLLGQEKRIGAFPVVDNGKLVGIATESDLVRFINVIDRHKVPIVSFMTYVSAGRVDCNLIIRVKTKEVNPLKRDLKKAKFKVV
jgi:acetoin utilization protein AcuB